MFAILQRFSVTEEECLSRENYKAVNSADYI